MPIEAPFSSVKEADDAYFIEQSGGSPTGDQGAGWGRMQTGTRLEFGGWVTAYQEETNGDRTRWFTIRTTEGGQLQALNDGGEAQDVGENQSLSDVPNFSTEDDARAAYRNWVETQRQQGNDPAEEGQGDQSENWADWQRLREVGDWTVWGRSHTEEDRAQFMVASTNPEGENIYLAPEGRVQSDPHIYDSFEAVRQAFTAWTERKNSEEIPESEQPTGNSPSRGQVSGDAQQSATGGGSGDLLDQLGGPVPALAVGTAALGGGYLYYTEVYQK